MGRTQIYCRICGGPFREGPQGQVSLQAIEGRSFTSGLSHTDRGGKEATAWLAKGVLLTTAHHTAHGVELDTWYTGETYALDLEGLPEEDSLRHVLTLDATYKEQNRFHLVETGQVPEAFVLESEPGPFYLAANGGCVVLAQYFIRTRSAVLNVQDRTRRRVLFARAAVGRVVPPDAGWLLPPFRVCAARSI